jgi:hypothetical protein
MLHFFIFLSNLKPSGDPMEYDSRPPSGGSERAWGVANHRLENTAVLYCCALSWPGSAPLKLTDSSQAMA